MCCEKVKQPREAEGAVKISLTYSAAVIINS